VSLAQNTPTKAEANYYQQLAPKGILEVLKETKPVLILYIYTAWRP